MELSKITGDFIYWTFLTPMSTLLLLAPLLLFPAQTQYNLEPENVVPTSPLQVQPNLQPIRELNYTNLAYYLL